jgi:hypothetical protein
LSLKSLSENVTTNKIRIKFYDFRRLMKFYDKMDKSIRPDMPIEIRELCQYPNYQIMLKYHGWKHISFHKHLVSENLLNLYLKFVQNIHETIEKSYVTLRHIDSNGQKILNTEMLREMMWSEELGKLGVVFQRWKVVVEKMSSLCQRFENDDTFTLDQKKGAYSKLLFYDRFTARVQELIYLLIRQSVSNIHEMDDPISTDALNLPIYREILNWIQNSKNSLKPYNETDLMLKDTEDFFK